MLKCVIEDGQWMVEGEYSWLAGWSVLNHRVIHTPRSKVVVALTKFHGPSDLVIGRQATILKTECPLLYNNNLIVIIVI